MMKRLKQRRGRSSKTTNANAKLAAQSDLSAHVAAYLAKGGKITKCTPGKKVSSSPRSLGAMKMPNVNRNAFVWTKIEAEQGSRLSKPQRRNLIGARPSHRWIVDLVARRCELQHHLESDRSMGNALANLVQNVSGSRNGKLTRDADSLTVVIHKAVGKNLNLRIAASVRGVPAIPRGPQKSLPKLRERKAASIYK
jgi:hypothetical protein